MISKSRKGLDEYHSSNSAKEKNALIKDILKKVIYYKTHDKRNDNSNLTVYPLFSGFSGNNSYNLKLTGDNPPVNLGCMINVVSVYKEYISF